jgi:hypothetical protein
MASNLGLSTDDVTSALQEEGYVVKDPEESIRQLAGQTGVAPSDVFAAIQKHFPGSTARLSTRPGTGGGMGRGMGGGTAFDCG